MPFSEEIKIKALISSGRCCCICHKRCGVKMEIHHIRAAADGGQDTFENAIPLCFDCHAEVRHYDPRHPKGTKFSEKELFLLRDNWYRQVENRNREKRENETKSTFEPVKIMREKGYEEKSLVKVTTGHQLLSILSGANAINYDYSKPNTADEADLIDHFQQAIGELIEFPDLLEYSGSARYGFELNDLLKQLSDTNLSLYVRLENMVATGGRSELSSFPVLIVRIVSNRTHGE